MPRCKEVAKKVDEVQRSRLSWQLGEMPQNGLELPIPINICEISNEVEYLPPKKKSRRSKTDYLSLLEPKLRELISEHDFYIGIKKHNKSDEKLCACLLGSFEVILQAVKAPFDVPDHPEFWLYVNEDDTTKCFLYFEEGKNSDSTFRAEYFPLDYLPPLYMMTTFRVKQAFMLTYNSYDRWKRQLTIDVLLKKSALIRLRFPSEAQRIKPNITIQNAINYFYNISPCDYAGMRRIRRHDIDALYDAVKNLRPELKIDKNDIQHPCLVPELRDYQVDAVRWMIQQEIKREDVDDQLHELYQVLKTIDNQVLYYNRYGGYLVKEKPLRVLSKPGGILADEMGLGKTVEVLACVLCNPREMEHNKNNGLALHRYRINNLDLDQLSDEDEEDDSYKESERTSKSSSTNSLEVNDESWNKPTTSSGTIIIPNNLPKPFLPLQETINVRAKFFDTNVPQKQFFECICGAFENITGMQDQLQCKECGLWQHKKCVYFDLHYGPYFCPHCWVAKPAIPSRATLIVCPSAIRNQWIDEIQRHIRDRSLELFEYTGINKYGFIQPPKLADNDLVITTYEILRRELHYVDLPHSNSESGRKFRHPKRFMALPSPLTAIEWWRICLDEAQMVECVTTRTAEMALRLSAVNRWCITGTPIQKSVEDLYGLFLFLGAEPYSVKAWWKECLYEPYCHGDAEPIERFLSQFLWRTIKMDVLDQIGLPEQIEEVHWLCFTPVEEHFYRQQHVERSRDAVANFNHFKNLDIKLNSLERTKLNKLLAPLLRLRQACCHPQAVKGQFISVHKSTLSMEELLESLIKKTKTEAEEAHRQNTAALNGLASLHIIKEEWVEAAEKYREVLRLADEHSKCIKTDKLQRLHALHNLSELLDSGHTNIPPTLRDDLLKSQAESLRKSYLVKCTSKVSGAVENLRVAERNVNEISNQIESLDSCWWAESIDNLQHTDRADELLERIRTDLLATSQPNRTSIANRFRDVHGLKFVIVNQLEALENAHDQLQNAVKTLSAQPDEKEVNDAVECHLRPSQKKRQKCIYCKVHELFNKYEGRLFCFNHEDEEKFFELEENDDGLLGQLRRGTWADSEVEKILKVILVFAKNHNACPLGGDEVPQMKLFEALKKEFRALRGVWMQIRDYVSALDELNMATIRLRCRLENEPKLDPPQLHILEESELDHHGLKLLSDQIISQNERKKKLGQLLYLKNLANSDFGGRKGNNPEPCPICQKSLGEQWSVLQCGHCFCVECIRVMVNHSMVRGRLKSVKCAICRQLTAPGEISYVNTKGEESEEEQQIEVKGSYSTKIEAIVRTLIQIHSKDPSAKALVFSTWTDVLDVLARALSDNDITYRSLLSRANFQANLSSFKHNTDVRVLLLPVQSGANGLNLIEATHVLLVEPILNPASELQAIGRVHRIGQTKPTVVHRFLVRNTIEERMATMLKSHRTGTSSHDSEENTLTINDLRKLFVDDEEI